MVLPMQHFPLEEERGELQQLAQAWVYLVATLFLRPDASGKRAGLPAFSLIVLFYLLLSPAGVLVAVFWFLGSGDLEDLLVKMVVTFPLLCFSMREHSNPLLTFSFQHWRRAWSAWASVTSGKTLSAILSEIYQILLFSIDKRTTCCCKSWQLLKVLIKSGN